VTKTELDEYKETELLELVQQTVEDLHRIGDRLESYANERIAEKNQLGET
jgi:hypothetical protein